MGGNWLNFWDISVVYLPLFKNLIQVSIIHSFARSIKESKSFFKWPFPASFYLFSSFKYSLQ